MLDPTVIAVLLLLAMPGRYVVRAWWSPFVACRRCDGAGERQRRFSRRAARCRRCEGVGQRLRFGVRVLNVARGAGR